MTTHRSELRDAVANALDLSEWGAGFEWVRSWSQSLDSESVPAFGVTARRERVSEFDKDQYARDVDVMVAWRRIGNDAIEDTIDADAADIEAIVLPILRPMVFNVIPRETEIDVLATDGGQRVGAGMVTFSCIVLTDIPGV